MPEQPGPGRHPSTKGVGRECCLKGDIGESSLCPFRASALLERHEDDGEEGVEDEGLEDVHPDDTLKPRHNTD